MIYNIKALKNYDKNKHTRRNEYICLYTLFIHIF